ncbi:MAG: precorrin-6A reductase [Candidatus Methanomethylophilus sp.]|nr:precorrin-6A reductase [Methanomethylophilus sp.]
MTAKVLVFAGTTEGGAIAAALARAGVQVHACVATEYGRTAVPAVPGIEVSAHPLSPADMRALMKEYPTVVDATHPYATVIKGHLREACRDTGAEYVRLRRPATDLSAAGVKTVPDTAAAVEFLKGTQGPVLVTTGSKELAQFTALPDYQNRIYARVLALPNVITQCNAAGFTGAHLFAMQGPYCEELDYGMLLQVHAKYLVTKDSGAPGGMPEKLAAARRAGAQVVLIGRPAEEGEGRDYAGTLAYLAVKFGLKSPTAAEQAAEPRTIILVGTGAGPGTGLTAAAAAAVKGADLVAGAARMLQVPETAGKPVLPEYLPDRILSYLGQHPEIRRTAVLVSGDVGFYSAAKALTEQAAAAGFSVETHCGISSVQYLCALAGVPWQDVRLVSAHGRTVNIVGEVRRSACTFALLSGAAGVREMCALLQEYGLGDVQVMVGCDLGYPEEKVLRGAPAEVAAQDPGRLCAALVFNSHPDRRAPLSLPDAEFIRGDAPMSKSEARALSVANLKLPEDAVVYDIGAGTGSVSVEMAREAVEGTVYAIERDETAAGLIEQNRQKFGTPNIEVVRGSAPEALEPLPAPTHVFIGGSSGNLKDIVRTVLTKNPRVRIVVNSVTLETITETLAVVRDCAVTQEEIVCLNVAGARHLGRYNLMTAQNPVYIAVLQGRGA